MTREHDSARYRARDAAVRRTHGIVAGVAAGAVALSGACSAVAAHAFKGHTTPAGASAAVPGPQTVPPISSDPAPLQPPAEPPAAAPPEPSAPIPEVSGGS